jgi:hypothetical protein
VAAEHAQPQPDDGAEHGAGGVCRRGRARGAEAMGKQPGVLNCCRTWFHSTAGSTGQTGSLVGIGDGGDPERWFPIGRLDIARTFVSAATTRRWGSRARETVTVSGGPQGSVGPTVSECWSVGRNRTGTQGERGSAVAYSLPPGPFRKRCEGDVGSVAWAHKAVADMTLVRSLSEKEFFFTEKKKNLEQLQRTLSITCFAD